MSLEAIRDLISEDLKATDQFIVSHFESNIPLLKQIAEYVIMCGGKRIRPIVLLLSVRALNPKMNKHIDLAAVIELVHTATILHDDVVDSSTLRRGHKTANAIWGNQACVLVGDFLYSRAFQILSSSKNISGIACVTNATHFLAEGEILQMVNRNNPDTTEEFYFEIILRKTAKLFEIASHLGALLSSNSENEVAALRDYGTYLGLAYQLIDDVLDYSQSADQTGKNVGQDITEGKTTLPLIHAMRKSSGATLELLREAIKTGSNEKLPAILGIIESTDAIKYTADAAKHHAMKAKKSLSNIASNPYRKALEDLADFVVERTY